MCIYFVCCCTSRASNLHMPPCWSGTAYCILEKNRNIELELGDETRLTTFPVATSTPGQAPARTVLSVQKSMRCTTFQRAITRAQPAAAQDPTYVTCSNASLFVETVKAAEPTTALFPLKFTRRLVLFLSPKFKSPLQSCRHAC